MGNSFLHPRSDLPSSIAVPVGMALHELAANAAEHGSRSTPGGSVLVSWLLECRQTQRELTIEWVERGGLTVVPPTRKGFGTQLLERVLARQVGAQVEVIYPPEGCQIKIALPLPNEESQAS